jgi:hypothetical protein
MALTASSMRYLNRKKEVLRELRNLARMPEGRFSYSARPHRTLPELVEVYPRPYVPPTPSSSSSSPTVGCDWDDPASIWDDTFYFDCDD